MTKRKKKKDKKKTPFFFSQAQNHPLASSKSDAPPE
jgi:hypothetical protein